MQLSLNQNLIIFQSTWIVTASVNMTIMDGWIVQQCFPLGFCLDILYVWLLYAMFDVCWVFPFIYYIYLDLLPNYLLLLNALILKGKHIELVL